MRAFLLCIDRYFSSSILAIEKTEPVAMRPQAAAALGQSLTQTPHGAAEYITWAQKPPLCPPLSWKFPCPPPILSRDSSSCEKLPEYKHHPHKAPKGHFTVIYFFLDQLPPPWSPSTSVQFVGPRVVLQASESLYRFVPCIALPVPLLGILATPESQIRGHTGPSEDPQLSIHTSLLPCLQQGFSCLSPLSLWQPLKKRTWVLIHSPINSSHGHLPELGAHSVDPWLSLEGSMGAIPVL